MHNPHIDVDATCREIGLKISPVRTTSFEILTRLMLAANAEGKITVSAPVEPLMQVFRDCHAMLDHGVREAFGRMGADIGEEFELSRRQTLEVVRSMLSALRAVAEGRTRPSHGVFEDLAHRIESDLRPSIGTFLKLLNEFARREAERRHEQTRSLVTKTIEEIEKISLSIKLISINASVEAAHAGDAGRGFAVIATEIRELSSKSQVALDGIKDRLI